MSPTMTNPGVPLAVALLLSALASAQTTPKVYLQGSEVYLLPPGSTQPKQLTNDGRKKFMLVQSASGERIVFLVEVEDSADLADIVVMRSDGSQVREIQFRPGRINPSDLPGMRGVEQLDWMGERYLLLSGSLNPSTGEYAKVDIATGLTVASYYTEGPSLVPSPDGSHVAYVGLIPHLTPEDQRRPMFCLDDECLFGQPARGYERKGAHLEYESPATWAPDGSSVAVLARNFDTNVQSVVVRRPGGASVEFTPPEGETGRVQFAWDGGAVVARVGNGVWRLDSGSAAFVRAK